MLLEYKLLQSSTRLIRYLVKYVDLLLGTLHFYY
ncbi:hypothetical protein ECH_0436 [Ehrlichia chaffeensis str. Arkansas]|uniref:Uncharacterized protein n=1 Tax=Ehrlichia chaffeensis (strain ATCC CRL-10679 / Arkansas) TaxID=205920 RepID=Q2GH29_EHRCR|nr:hypothetical protein ECH_0436 [Ehrlichia chaffeensis str. Arkansas]